MKRLVAALTALLATQAFAQTDLDELNRSINEGQLYDCFLPCDLTWKFPTHKLDGVTPLAPTDFLQTYIDWGYCSLNSPNGLIPLGLHRRRIVQAPTANFRFPDNELQPGQVWCVQMFALQKDGIPTVIFYFRLMVPPPGVAINRVGKPLTFNFPPGTGENPPP